MSNKDQNLDEMNLPYELWVYNCKLRGIGDLLCNYDDDPSPFLDHGEGIEGLGLILRGVADELRDLSRYMDEEGVRKAQHLKRKKRTSVKAK